MFLIISVELPGDHGALGPVVPVVESVGGEVEMFPTAEDIIERGVEIASAVFVAVVVVIQGGEGWGCSPLLSGLVDGGLGGVLLVEPAHVVQHLVVKV